MSSPPHLLIERTLPAISTPKPAAVINAPVKPITPLMTVPPATKMTPEPFVPAPWIVPKLVRSQAAAGEP